MHAKQILDLKNSIDDLLQQSAIISNLLEIALKEDHDLFLVGGFVRDVLLGRASNDLDFASARALEIAEALAVKTRSRLVYLDRKFNTIRIITPAGPQRQGVASRFDLSPLRGSSIETDLAQRDFTINALAIDFSVWPNRRLPELIDPLGGLADLRAYRLRACTSRSFAQDPLRILRAYRLAANYGFSIEAETKKWMLEMRKGLRQIAVERMRDELMLVLASPNAASILRMADEDGILRLILPETDPLRGLLQNDFHHLDVWEHCLLAFEALEAFLGRPQELLGSYAEEALESLSQQLAGERNRLLTLKLAVLIHDIGKPCCQTMDKHDRVHFYGHEIEGARLAASLCSRLRFSNREINYVSQLIRHHMWGLHLFDLVRPSQRALSRFFRLGPALFWPLILLFAADYRATLGLRSLGGDMQELRNRIRTWLDFHHRQIKPITAAPPLVNGHDLMGHLRLSPGPLVGKLLNALAESQWEGRINSREEALRLASQLLRGWGNATSA